MNASLAQRLNRSCFCAAVDLPALHRWLERDLRARGFTEPLVASHPHLFSASPVFVAADQVAEMGAIIAAVESVVALPAYRARALDAAPSIARRAQPTHGGLLSYDFHLADAGPRLIEINTNPGGLLLTTALRRAQRACCASVEHFAPGQEDGDAIENALHAMFIREWSLARGDTRPARVLIVDEAPQSQYLYPEFLLYQGLLESRGLATDILPPSALRFADDALWHADQRLDLVYNRLTDFYLAKPDDEPLRRAYEADAAVVIPHPHAHALYANKRNLAILSDMDLLSSLGVPDQHRAVLQAGVPRTLPIGTASRDEWWTTRKQWFFKPASGFGSGGSYRGEKLTRGKLEEIVAADYVAQALVPPTERWPREGETPLKLDLRVYVYAGTMLALAARLYQGQTTNFRTPGGGFAPVFVTPAESSG